MEKQFTQGQEFFLINWKSLEKHIVAWLYELQWETMYIFTPQWQVHNIKATEMFATEKEAQEWRIKRLKESAEANLKEVAELEEKDMEVVEIPQVKQED